MGDPTKNIDKVLTQAPLQNRTRILSIESIPSWGELSTAAQSDALHKKKLQSEVDLLVSPYEPVDKIIWAIKRAFAQELTNQRRMGLAEALNSLDQGKGQFLVGTIVGIGKAGADIAASYVANAKDAIGGVIQFYTMVADPEIWTKILVIWLGGSSNEFDEFADYLNQNYAEVWLAISTFPKCTEGIKKFFANLQDEQTIANLCVKLTNALVTILTFDKTQNKDRIDEFIGLNGKYYDQGVLIGETVGVAVIQAILFMLSMHQIVRSLLRLGQELITVYADLAKEFTRLLEGAQDLEELAKLKAIEKTAQNLYQDLSDEFKPYSNLSKRTGLFNKYMDTLVGRQSTEFIGLRLDADHIFEARTFPWFEKEFQALGWQNAKDMDALAVHTEFHIRSGTGLTDVFQIQDQTLVGQPSLTRMKLAYIGSDPKKYPNLLALVDTYESFYQSQAPLSYSDKLQQWFANLRAMIKARDL